MHYYLFYRSRFRSPSYQIQEGDSINIDVTSPGATLALGLMFFRSGNRNVAAWMEAPDSQFLLEFVRPDFLMLRTLAKGLILWDDITPTSDWIESHIPKSIRHVVAHIAFLKTFLSEYSFLANKGQVLISSKCYKLLSEPSSHSVHFLPLFI